MILDLKNHEDFPAEFELTEKSANLDLGRDDVKQLENVTVNLSVQLAEQEYYCQGTVAADFRLECARCLAEFKATLSGPTDFIIRSPQPPKEDEAGIPDDEDYVDLLDGMKVDLSGIVRQTLLLALPISPVCKDDCLGLCTSCGVNKNEKKCDCKNQSYDERWEGLAGLSQDL